MSNKPSLLSKLKNKVNYKINEAVDDPEANKYAEEQKKLEEQEKKDKPASVPIKTPEQLNQEKLTKYNSDPKNIEFGEKKLVPILNKHLIIFENKLKSQNKSSDDIKKELGNEFTRILKLVNDNIIQDKTSEDILKILEKDFMKTDDPTANEFNIKRIVSNTWESIKYIASIVFFPILSLIIASVISNEVVMYPAPMRLAFFLITFIICILIKPVLFIIIFYYLGRWALQYYINEMTDRPKVKYLPTFFAFIPLRKTEPESGFMKFLLAPFLYGILRSKQDDKELNVVMEKYNTALHDSFKYIDKIKDQEPYKKGLDKIKTHFETLHKPTKLPIGISTTQPSTNIKEPGTPNTNTLPKTINEAIANTKKAEFNAELDRRVQNAINKERENTKLPLALSRQDEIRIEIRKQMETEEKEGKKNKEMEGEKDKEMEGEKDKEMEGEKDKEKGEEKDTKEEKEEPLPPTIKEVQNKEYLNKRVEEAIEKEKEDTKLPLKIGRENEIRKEIQEQINKDRELIPKEPNTSVPPKESLSQPQLPPYNNTTQQQQVVPPPSTTPTIQ